MSNTDQLLEDIPEYGSAFVCGKSRFEEGKFHVRDDPILQLSCGDEHTGVVTKKGRVFMFGSNNWGQLGLGHENNVDRPSCIKSLKHEKAKLIACGRNHTLVATEEGHIYSFGCNSESQLGLGDDATNSFYNSPQKIGSLDREEWIVLSAGAGHSCALSRKGVLYVWGINDNGEIGLGKTVEQPYPKMIDIGAKIKFVSCGYYHTALITKNGELLTSGSNEYFQLGRDGADSRRFRPVEDIEDPIKYVSCGGGHTVAVSDIGRVFTFGDGSKGQLGNGPDLQKSMPTPVKALKKIKIDKVACGECHTAFVTEDGQLYSCGDNRYGKLGLNQKTFNSIQFTPVLVQKFKTLSVDTISCGGCHMILVGRLAKRNFSDQDEYDQEHRYHRNTYSSRDEMKLTSSRNNLRNSNQSPRKYYSNNNENKYTHTNRDSESEFDNEEAERTFNRTHTLTRDNKFIPLSELNLKKLVKNEEEATKMSKKSRYNNDSRSTYSNFQTKNNNNNRNTRSKYDNDDQEDSEDSSNNTYRGTNNKSSPIMRTKNNNRNFKSFSDDEEDRKYYNKSSFDTTNTINSSKYGNTAGDKRYRNNINETPRSTRNEKEDTEKPNSYKEKKFKICTIL